MDVTLRVPTGKQAVSVGRLDSHTTEGGRDVWHWVSSQPMATYLNFFAIGGDFRIEQGGWWTAALTSTRSPTSCRMPMS